MHAHNGGYAESVEVLRGSHTNIHPRIGIILLEQSITGFLDHNAQVASSDSTGNSNLILSVSVDIRDKLYKISPHNSIYTVKEFLGFPGNDLDIPDAKYFLPTFSHRMKKDRELCDLIRELSTQVLQKISKEGFPS